MQRWFLIIFLVLPVFSYSEKTETITSLLKKLNKNSENNKSEVFIQLSEASLNLDSIDAYNYALQAIASAQTNTSKSTLVKAYLQLSKVFERQYQLDSAINRLQAMWHQLNENTHKEELALIESKLCVLYSQKEDYKTAFPLCESALKKFKNLDKKKEVSYCYNTIGVIYNKQGDYSQSLDFYKKSYQLKLELGDEKGMANSENNIGITYIRIGLYEQAIDYLNKAILSKQRLNDSVGMATTLNNLGLAYYEQGNYAKALKHYLAATTILEHSPFTVGLVDCYINLGNFYKKQEKDDKALTYHVKVLALGKKYNIQASIAYAYNNIGKLYLKVNTFDSALVNFSQSLDIKESLNDKHGSGVSNFNIGMVYFRKEQYDSALIYFSRSIALHKQTGNLHEQSSTLLYYGKTLAKQGKTSDAEETLLKSISLAEQIGSLPLLEEVYLGLSDFYQTKNPKKALNYHKIYTDYKDSIFNLDKQRLIEQYQVKYDVLNQEKKLDDLKRENNIKQSRIYFSVVGFGSILIIACLIILLLLLKRRKERTIYKLSSKILNDQVRYQKNQLQIYTHNLLTKSKIINELKEQIKILNLSQKTDDFDSEKKIGELITSKILTDADWHNFKVNFESVYPGVIVKLRNNYPDLTEAEQRLFLLMLLKMDTKEIATILGISIDSVRKSRYRLKKKLLLESEDNLEDFITSFSA